MHHIELHTHTLKWMQPAIDQNKLLRYDSPQYIYLQLYTHLLRGMRYIVRGQFTRVRPLGGDHILYNCDHHHGHLLECLVHQRQRNHHQHVCHFGV